jgi:RNA polymerase sigma-70 factor, ECF subfamily
MDASVLRPFAGSVVSKGVTPTAERPAVAGADLRRVVYDFVARRVADRHTADDLTQEILLKAHRADMAPGSVDDVAAWLYRIARNTLVDHYRQRDRHPRPGELPDELVDHQLVDPDLDGTADEARAQLAGCLRAMVDGLDAIYRDALTLTDLGDLSQAEAARRAGLSVSTMKSRVQRARAQLRAAVTACCAVQTDVTGRVRDYEPPSDCCN